MFSAAQLLSAFIGVLIPLLNGFITKYSAVKARVFLGLILSAVNGLAVEWLNALTTSADFNLTQAAGGALLSLVTALAVEAKVWAPLGVSEAVKSSGVGGKSATATTYEGKA